MGFLDDFAKDIYSQVKSRWYRRTTLLLAIGLFVIVFLSLSASIDLSKVTIAHLGLGLGGVVAVSIFWYVTTRPPRAKQDTVGFGVAIATETKEQYDRIVADFILTLRSLLNRSRFRYKFSFIIFPPYFSEQIQDQDDAIRLLRASRVRFLMYGRVRTRIIAGKDTYVLDLEGAVSHRAGNPSIRSEFSKEMVSVFPRKINVSAENEIFSFEITAELIKIVAMHIIGTAALLSGDPAYARDIFEELQKQLAANKLPLPAVLKIKELIPSRLIDVYYLQAWLCFGNWAKTRDPQSLLDAKDFLDDLLRVDPENPNGHLMRSTWLFVVNNDIKAAKNEALRCKDATDNETWRYNYAFLLAYEGNLDAATKQYKRAVKSKIPPLILQEITEFIPWAIEQDPEKAQLYFCLGFIYYFAADDKSKASNAFREFIRRCPANLFPPQIKLAKEYLRNIGEL